MAVTMKDIGMLAGVSRQAVSAVLNKTSNSRVAPEKRDKILRIAKELNYVPNFAARALKGGQTGNIGVIGSLFGSTLNTSLLYEISQILEVKGYNLLYSNVDNVTDVSVFEKLVAKGVDGVIVFNKVDGKLIRKKFNIPCLFYSHANKDFMDVGIDNEYGSWLATKHLLEHGHEKVLMMSIQSIAESRIAGWKRAHIEQGKEVSINLDTIILRELDGDVKKTIALLKKMKVTAIHATNDYIAAKLIAALFENGIRVPEDIAVVGYDGNSFCQFSRIPLTTIVQQVRPQAEIGAELLLKRIEAKEYMTEPANVLIKPLLFQGASCGCKAPPLNKLYRLNSYMMLEKDLKMNFDENIE